jgi:hypothetical protein
VQVALASLRAGFCEAQEQLLRSVTSGYASCAGSSSSAVLPVSVTE